MYGVITTGAENDLEQVTGIARGMVARWGMSDRLAVSVLAADDEQPFGMSAAPHTLDLVDGETRRIVEECYAEACRTLEEHRPQLDDLAAALLEHETLEESDVYRVARIGTEPPVAAGLTKD